MKPPPNSLFSADIELLRKDPVLWACNLHHLRRVVFWYSIPLLVVVALIWIRVSALWAPAACAVLLFLTLLTSLGIVNQILEEYSGIPSDEYIPTPGHVHVKAFLSRFVALAIVLTLPLLLSELMLYKARTMSDTEVIADLNTINVGAQASGLSAYFPHSSADKLKLQSMGLLTESQARETSRTTASAQSLKHKMSSVIAKYLPGSNWEPISSDQSTLGERAKSAATQALLRLRVKGVIGDGSGLIRYVFYLDVLLISAVFAVWVGLAGKAVFIGAFVIWMSPVILCSMPVTVVFLLWLLFPIPTDVVQYGLAWSGRHAVHLIGLYVAVLFAIYAVAITRVLTPPQNVNRSISFHYALSFVSIPLGIAPVLTFVRLVVQLGNVSLPEIMHVWVLIDLDNAFRIASLVILIVYLIFFTYLRREGERMRALPRLTSPAEARTT